MNDNFFQKSAFGGNGLVSGFQGMDCHASTFNSFQADHLTFNKPFNPLGQRRDFSLETGIRLDGFNQMGGLEQRTALMNTILNSPFGSHTR